MRRVPLWLSKVLKVVSVSLLCILFFHYGQNIPFEKQWPLYDGLRNTSAIIFGVMGAWIALIYPEALSSLLGKINNSDNDSKAKEAEKLLPPLVYSAVILIFVLLVGILAPIFNQIPLLVANYKIVRGISYSLLGLLTICQLWTVILTLLPADLVKQDINRLRNKQIARKRLLSRTQSKSQKD